MIFIFRIKLILFLFYFINDIVDWKKKIIIYLFGPIHGNKNNLPVQRDAIIQDKVRTIISIISLIYTLY